jgi:hypothetical protein
MALLSAKDNDLEKKCPHGLPCLLGEPHHHVAVASSSSGPMNFELADVHGLIKEICVTSKHGTS